MSVEDRLQKAEEKLAYAEQTIEQLNEVVTGLNEKLRRIEHAVEDLKDHLPGDSDESPDQPPPHYGGLNSAS
jgi:SlyX protein